MCIARNERVLERLGLRREGDVQALVEGKPVDVQEQSRIVIETGGQQGWNGLLGEEWAKKAAEEYEKVRARTESAWHDSKVATDPTQVASNFGWSMTEGGIPQDVPFELKAGRCEEGVVSFSRR